MSASKLAGIIRTQKDCFETPNIYSTLQRDIVEIHLSNFRTNKQDREFILFYEFAGELYFPIWFEFRSINNNLLFLFEEYQICNFTDIKRVLISSLEKEEHSSADIKALVFHTLQMPHFSYHLPKFNIEIGDRLDVNECLS